MRKIIRFLDLFFFLLQKKVKFKKTANAIAIIKIDAIGDYLVFRNCLQAIAESEAYKNYSITLIGNVLWKDLATSFDEKYVTEFIWIEPHHLNSLKERKELFKSITRKNFKQLITFHHSRALATDVLSLVINARRKITLRGDELNINARFNKITSLFYDQLFKVPSEIEHEFDKNKFFTSWLTSEEVKFKRPFLNLNGHENAYSVSSKTYIVVAPGAGVVNRQISPDILKKAMDYLLEQKISLYIVGSVQEEKYVDDLLHDYKNHPLIENFVGKTSLKELAFIVNGAKAVICNESSVFHMAVSLSKITICFAGGGHFKRFAAYPYAMNVHVIYNEMPCFNCNWKCIFKFDKSEAYPCIKTIDPATVMDVLDKEIIHAE
jgi:ADP-heptose:LPS heptosyltransferase